MKKKDWIAQAEAAGVVRTPEHLDVTTITELKQLIKDFEKLSEDEKLAANEKAADEFKTAQEEEKSKAELKAKEDAELKAKQEEEEKALADKKVKDEGEKPNSSKANLPKLQDKIDSIFKSYPTCDECYSTSDGELFLKLNPAENHQRSLKQKLNKIKKHER